MDYAATLDRLITYLISESTDSEIHKSNHAINVDEKFEQFRKLCNVREPQPIPADFLQEQDAFLSAWNDKRSTITLNDLQAIQDQIYLWQGDITRLALDAIVNAANSYFIGCTIPNHHCIDNIIHTRAGVQLRLDCHNIIQEQGRLEPAGKAKITKGYNLPAKHVIHTVGPYIDERGVTPIKAKLLRSCYRSVLELADQKKLQSVAFCCIGTGEFNYPNKAAATIAIDTVRSYLAETDSQLHVVFNVFKDIDLHIYQTLLNQ